MRLIDRLIEIFWNLLLIAIIVIVFIAIYLSFWGTIEQKDKIISKVFGNPVEIVETTTVISEFIEEPKFIFGHHNIQDMITKKKTKPLCETSAKVTANINRRAEYTYEVATGQTAIRIYTDSISIEKLPARGGGRCDFEIDFTVDQLNFIQDTIETNYTFPSELEESRMKQILENFINQDYSKWKAYIAN